MAARQQMSTAELAEQARHAGVSDPDRMNRDELMDAMQARPGRYGGGPPQKARSGDSPQKARSGDSSQKAGSDTSAQRAGSDAPAQKAR
ncbi:hypothetical protein [Polymorphospora rubra]|uniref:Rho termination factor N-terminal domain-containing protein n=1 Tax=Polymorphospora rubra TaxID=338584 RepID=A0A810MRI0_9ACTN|nr:hypothetical protein [Polymorphospora rubra]BCJ63274.1 hypothetical protein Prubr_02950 [Polymorphospora rubra]